MKCSYHPGPKNPPKYKSTSVQMGCNNKGQNYGKPEGSNQQISLHTGHLCRKTLCQVSSSYITIIFLCNANLAAKGRREMFSFSSTISYSSILLATYNILYQIHINYCDILKYCNEITIQHIQ